MGTKVRTSYPNRRRGAALILCIFMTATVLTSITMLSLRTIAHVRHSQYAAWHSAAMAGAELVLGATQTAIERGEPGTAGIAGDGAAILTGDVVPRVDDEGIEGQVIEGVPELTWYAVAGPTLGAGSDTVTILAVASVYGVHGAVEGVFQRSSDGKRLERIAWRPRPVGTVGALP